MCVLIGVALRWGMRGGGGLPVDPNRLQFTHINSDVVFGFHLDGFATQLSPVGGGGGGEIQTLLATKPRRGLYRLVDFLVPSPVKTVLPLTIKSG